MTFTNRFGEIYLIGPDGESTAVKPLAKFDFDSGESRDNFFWMILAMIRINRSIITCLPRRKGWATINLAVREEKIFSEHRSSQVPLPLDGQQNIVFNSTIRVFENTVQKFCPVEHTSGEPLLDEFYKAFNSDANRPSSLPTEMNVEFSKVDVRVATVISKPVALQPENPAVENDS